MENKATGLLVVGYGNPLNSDDGAGWSAAVELEASLKNTSYADHVEMMALHQLTSELAETVSRFQSVIFIGVCCGKNAGVVCCRNIEFSADVETEGMRVAETAETENEEIVRSGSKFSDNSEEHDKAMTGQISPEHLVYMARTKYNANQDAILYTISGLSFEQGEKISRPVKRGVRFVVEDIRETILRQFNCYESDCSGSSSADSQSKGLLDAVSLDIAELV